MLVKNIYTEKRFLTILDVNNTIGEAIKEIDSKKLLSLPVLDGNLFVGVLSKKFILEEFFTNNMKKEDFLKQPVSLFMKTKMPHVGLHDIIEVPAKILSDKDIQFVPVVDSYGNLEGIVTHKAIFKALNMVLGLNESRLTITTYNKKGALASLTRIVAKKGGNIINMTNIDIDLMNLNEIVMRVKVDDLNDLIKAIESKGFKVRRVD